MDATLHQFFVDYAAWIDAGAPDCRPYSRGMGLCGNISLTHQVAAPELEELLDEKFPGTPSFPFNEGAATYIWECKSERSYLNEGRAAFVRQMVIEGAQP